ncbi:MAG TPA: YIP1 family protein [Bacteroidales bacterium]|nr:YIP1 family protein [Bacteroidales bacterium]
MKNTFDFNKFIADSKNTLFNPKGYFESMSTTGGMVEPLLKALIYGLVAAIINAIWFFALGSVVSFGMFGGAFGVVASIMTIIGAIIGLFIGAVIILLLSSISGGNTDFEASLRVSASLMVLMPINAVLGVFPVLSGFIGVIVSLAISLYGLYLLYLALTKTMKGKDETARIIIYVLIGLLVIVQVIGFFGRRAARKFTTDFSKFEKIYDETKSDEQNADYNYYSNKKPDAFPTKALEVVRVHLSTGSGSITKEMIEKLVKLTEELNKHENEYTSMMELVKEFGYTDISEYTNDYLVVISGITAVSSLNAMEQLMKASEKEKKAAEGFLVDEMLKNAAIQSILSGKLTESDLITIFNNWDSAKDLENKTVTE